MWEFQSDRKNLLIIETFPYATSGDTWLRWIYYCKHFQHMKTRNTANGFIMYRSWKKSLIHLFIFLQKYSQLFLFGWEIKWDHWWKKKILKEMCLSSSFEGISMDAAVVQFILMFGIICLIFIYLIKPDLFFDWLPIDLTTFWSIACDRATMCGQLQEWC